jgi:Toprim domain
MADQIVITEKSSQAKDVRAAVGSRYGDILPAEGHLLDLLEPEDVVPAWKRWSPILLRPEGLYGTRPAQGGNKAAKLKVIREALRTAKRVWLATDCDREGQLIGQEILEHYNYRGQVMRSLRRTSRPSATHSIEQNQMPSMPGFMPLLWRAAVAPVTARRGGTLRLGLILRYSASGVGYNGPRCPSTSPHNTANYRTAPIGLPLLLQR